MNTDKQFALVDQLAKTIIEACEKDELAYEYEQLGVIADESRFNFSRAELRCEVFEDGVRVEVIAKRHRPPRKRSVHDHEPFFKSDDVTHLAAGSGKDLAAALGDTYGRLLKHAQAKGAALITAYLALDTALLPFEKHLRA